MKPLFPIRLNPVEPHSMFSVHKDEDNSKGDEDGSERSAGSDHKHDDHLQFSGLLH